jgi:hypothetical protein
VATIWINGVAYPLTWTTLTDWTVAVPLVNGTNVLNLTGVDHYGQPISGDTGSVSVVYRGTNAPSLAYIDYNQSGLVYTQNFDGLPDPGAVSVDSGNTVTINGITYSLANPYDFASPVVASGSSGGLGVTNLAGWYGMSALESRFGASEGDLTAGGQNSFGLPESSNRALGLLATSTTGGTAFGARFLNDTTGTLNAINVQLTGELWRQSNLPKTLQCYYFIDPTGASSFPTNVTGYLPALNVNSPTSAAATGGVATNGTLTVNQTNLSINQTITNWPAGAMLWLVWQMTDSTGKAQGLAIDNLNFVANVAPPALSAAVSGNALTLTWPTVLGQTYQLEYKDSLADPTWTPLGSPVSGTGNPVTVTNDPTASTNRFFRLVAQ